MTNDQIVEIFVNSFIISVIIASILTYLKSGNNADNDSLKGKIKYSRLFLKLPLSGFIYFIIYTAFGLIVFQPIAGEAFNNYYPGLQEEMMKLGLHNIFIIQVIRGMLFAVFLMPVINMFNGTRKELFTVIPLYLGVITSTLLLMPSPYMPFEIRIGHLPEVFLSMTLTGFIYCKMFLKNLKN